MSIDWKLTKEIIGIIGGVYATIKGAAAGVNVYLKWTGNRAARKASNFAGNWNNQGQIRKVPTHYIDMDSLDSGREFRAQFNVRLGHDERSWRMFSITGKQWFGKMRCKIMDGDDEESTVVAKGVLKMHGKTMEWVLKEGNLLQFPEKAILRRGLPKIA
jgi:hypothetical protein